jgi:hypothetical protein
MLKLELTTAQQFELEKINRNALSWQRLKIESDILRVIMLEYKYRNSFSALSVIHFPGVNKKGGSEVQIKLSQSFQLHTIERDIKRMRKDSLVEFLVQCTRQMFIYKNVLEDFKKRENL